MFKPSLAFRLVLFLTLAVPRLRADVPIKPFIDVTEAMGLKGNNGGVAAWGDFDNDGWVDLCIGGEIWRNEEGKKFTRFGRVAGPAIWGDFDNDGYLDLFCFETGKLYRNIKGKEFKEVPFPPRPMKVSIGACWGDFDGDGFLDIYLAGYEAGDASNYQPHAIYRNKGDGTFEEVWRTKGRFQPGRGVTAADFNEDGHLDIFVSNYRLEANLLWLNDGKGKFTDVAKEYNAAGNKRMGWYGHTIGSAWGDLDNDGHLDLFVGNFSHPPEWQDRSQFLRNMGPAGKWHFEDMTKIANLRWQESYASPALGDFDNDGWLDLYFSTVYPGDKSVLYRNLGKWKFQEIKNGAGLSLPQTYQAAWADFNNDGHLDLITGGRLFKNPGNSNHWLKVRLEGSGKVNRAAIGAQVRLTLDKQTLTRQVEGATGQGNQNDLTLHFGLGARKDPVRLEIRWPDGTRQEIDTPVDRLVTVKRRG
jgi:hypothetical protein